MFDLGKKFDLVKGETASYYNVMVMNNCKLYIYIISVYKKG